MVPGGKSDLANVIPFNPVTPLSRKLARKFLHRWGLSERALVRKIPQVCSRRLEVGWPRVRWAVRGSDGGQYMYSGQMYI